MIKSNNKISGFQIGVLSFFISCALFIGLGTTIIFEIAKQDAWVVTIASFLLSLIPIFIIIYIINYKPDKNIFEKNITLFGKTLGHFINLILVIYVALLGIIITCSITFYVVTQYLTRTPHFFLASLIIIPAIYAVIKGIETISRTSEILFFISAFLIFIILTSLLPLSNFIRLKPFFTSGFQGIGKGCLYFLSYLLTPMVTLLVIPKNKVESNQHYPKFLIGGIFWGIFVMFTVFTVSVGIIGIELSSLFRFPEYYTHKKISIGGAIDNIENFTSSHWFFNQFMLATLCIYFISEYIKSIFKIKKRALKNILTILIGGLLIILSKYIFKDCTTSLQFMKNIFPFYFSLILFVILLLIALTIFIKSKLKRKMHKIAS